MRNAPECTEFSWIIALGYRVPVDESEISIRNNVECNVTSELGSTYCLATKKSMMRSVENNSVRLLQSRLS